ncbi:MAG: SMC-Scp complex subunit ScpB [Nitrospirota bacterium]
MTTNGVAMLETPTERDAADRAALEAVLFLSVEPVPLAQLAKAAGIDESRANALLELLAAELDGVHRGLQLAAVAGGYRLLTKPEVADVVRRYKQITSSARLSKAALETLAIIAYRQPALRTEIEAIRGVDCAGVLKTLLDHRLVKIVGRRDLVGRPIVYGTTREFLEYFGLHDLTELPTLKEFEELARQAPVESSAPVLTPGEEPLYQNGDSAGFRAAEPPAGAEIAPSV